MKKEEKGFTILEVIIVISIIGIMATIAVGSLIGLLPKYRLNKCAKEFAHNVQMARLLSIAQNRQYRIYLAEYDPSPSSLNWRDNAGRYLIQAGDSSDNSTTWDTLPIGAESDNEGDIDFSVGSECEGVSITSWTSIGGPGIGNADSLVFSPRGWIQNPDSDFDSGSGYIKVYFRSKQSNPALEQRIVKISRGGTVTITNRDDWIDWF